MEPIVTSALSARVTRRVRRISRAHDTGYTPGSASGPVPLPEGAGPHGLVDDRAGTVRYTGMMRNAVGVLDPKTGGVKEFKMPEGYRGPHTPVIDPRPSARSSPGIRRCRPGFPGDGDSYAVPGRSLRHLPRA